MGDVVSSVELGMKIKLLRQQAGLSQEKLAELVGVTFQQIQKYENGHTTLNIIKLQHIAQSLKVSVLEFFSSAPTHNVRLTSEEDQLLQSFRRIKNIELRDSILKLVGNVNKRAKGVFQ
jgi:transcriptional regulator with XRE-family HTH domain